MCSACLAQVRPQPQANLCEFCETRLDADSYAARQDRLCDECREAKPAFDRIIGYGEYSGELRELIHLLKFSGIHSAARVLASRMAGALEQHRSQIQPADQTGQTDQADRRSQDLLITSVPLFRSKQSARGFNQSSLLAAELVKLLLQRGWQVTQNYQLLQRRRATRSQSELNLRQRRANLRGVFAAGDDADRIAGASVLMVDDIVTTGATARQCAAVLKRKGAATVWVVAAARSQREDTATWEATANREVAQ